MLIIQSRYWITFCMFLTIFCSCLPLQVYEAALSFAFSVHRSRGMKDLCNQKG